MKRGFVFAGAVVLLAAAALGQRRVMRGAETGAPPLANSEGEKKILAVLDGIVKSHETYLSVPLEDGRMLRVLTEAAGARTVVEIGTSTGYSGLWFALALARTGGRLTTFELDHERAQLARGHFAEAGVEKLITVIEGDAHEHLAKVKGPVDVVFIDAEKEGYVDYLKQVMPLVRAGGLILAHNIDSAPEYVKAVTSNPDLETVFYRQGAGLGVTLKKR